MKNISLFSFTLCLMVSSVCLGESEVKYSEELRYFMLRWMEQHKNPFRRKTTVVYPNGQEEVVYRKDAIKEMFQKCRSSGACKGSGDYSVKVGDYDIVREHSMKAGMRLLDVAPKCTKAVMQAPPAPAPAPVKRIPVLSASKTPDTSSSAAPVVKTSEELEKPVVVVEKKPALVMTSDLTEQQKSASVTPEQTEVSSSGFFARNKEKVLTGGMILLVLIGYNCIPSPKRGDNR